jgi:hypothetical protein
MIRSAAVAYIAACLGILASLSAAAADEGSSTRISGRIFADFTDLDHTNDGVDSPESGIGIDVKRFYLGVTHEFDATWSVNVTSDFNYVSGDDSTQLFIKKAYVQARISEALIGRLGAADMPWIPFVEDLYGYRYVENVIIDRLRFGTSSDWGVHGRGQLPAGMFNYAVAIVNGGGYRNPTRSNSMDVEARFGFVPIEGLTIAIGGYSGKLGNDVSDSPTPPLHTATRGNALIAYVGGPWRLGAEYFQARNWDQVSTVQSDKADGVSVWGSFDFATRWSLFARADSARPSRELSPNLEDRYFNLGLAYRAHQDVNLALVYKHEKVDGGGAVDTTNGVIGGLVEGKYAEIGIWVLAEF